VDEPEPSADEVALYESKLRRRASAHIGGGDPALGELLRTIESRRSARSRRPPAGPTPGGAVTQRLATQGPGIQRSCSQQGIADHPIAERPSPLGTRPGQHAPRTGGNEAGQILAIESYGPTVRVFRIGRPPGFDFRPGQHFKLGVPGGKLETFSVASAPYEPHLDVTVELRPGGQVTPALFALGVGDTVAMGAKAKGGLRLDPGLVHHLMVATVTGIAPLRSMVRDALHHGTSATFTVLLGASLAAELPFHDELQALATREPHVTYIPTVSQPNDPANRSWSGSTGRVDALAREVASGLDPARTHVYAVGNPGMIEAVRRDLGGTGFEISTESYGN